MQSHGKNVAILCNLVSRSTDLVCMPSILSKLAIGWLSNLIINSLGKCSCCLFSKVLFYGEATAHRVCDSKGLPKNPTSRVCVTCYQLIPWFCRACYSAGHAITGTTVDPQCLTTDNPAQMPARSQTLNWYQSPRRGLEAKPPARCCLAPITKQTGQDSGVSCADIFQFWSFLQSTSVNNICKLIHLLGDFVLWTPPRAFTDATERLPSPGLVLSLPLTRCCIYLFKIAHVLLAVE